MKKLIVSALALALAGPAIAQAAPANQPISVKVRHGDLNLERSSDARIMVRRIERAALNACGASDGSVREYRMAIARTACYRETLDAAVATLNVPSVSAAYHARTSFNVASN